jgi:hypothetical protein
MMMINTNTHKSQTIVQVKGDENYNKKTIMVFSTCKNFMFFVVLSLHTKIPWRGTKQQDGEDLKQLWKINVTQDEKGMKGEHAHLKGIPQLW